MNYYCKLSLSYKQGIFACINLSKLANGAKLTVDVVVVVVTFLLIFLSASLFDLLKCLFFTSFITALQCMPKTIKSFTCSKVFLENTPRLRYYLVKIIKVINTHRLLTAMYTTVF